MSKRIDARDVLDPNSRTTRPIAGRITGHFRPLGPNAWDDFEFVSENEGAIDVLPGLEVQREDNAPAFRMRWHGRVVRVAFDPAHADALVPFASDPGRGAAGVIAEKLRSGDG
jgi:hypothetical protein